MPKQIIVDIDVEGNVTIEADGYTGKECLSATAPFEKALGAKATERKHKPEMNRRTTVSTVRGTR